MTVNLLDNDEEVVLVRTLYKKSNCYLDGVLRCMMEDAAEMAQKAIDKIMKEKVE